MRNSRDNIFIEYPRTSYKDINAALIQVDDWLRTRKIEIAGTRFEQLKNNMDRIHNFYKSGKPKEVKKDLGMQFFIDTTDKVKSTFGKFIFLQLFFGVACGLLYIEATMFIFMLMDKGPGPNDGAGYAGAFIGLMTSPVAIILATILYAKEKCQKIIKVLGYMGICFPLIAYVGIQMATLIKNILY